MAWILFLLTVAALAALFASQRRWSTMVANGLWRSRISRLALVLVLLALCVPALLPTV